MGQKVFLSYAEEDKKVALNIYARLKDKGCAVYYWEDPEQRGNRFLDKIEKEIKEANKFIVCLSKNYLKSQFCQREGKNAIGLESDSANPRKEFIVVAKVGSIKKEDAGFWRDYDWFDMIGRNREEELDNLIKKVTSEKKTNLLGVDWPSFQNREQERDYILGALNNVAGDRFFLILSGPQMGKTWLAQKIKEEVQKTTDERWHTEIISLHEYPKDSIKDPGFIVGKFFESTLNEKADSRNIKEIVKSIARSRRKWLCILDGEELLSEDCAFKVREICSQIYKEVKAKVPSADFSFIVTSRTYHDAWRGLLLSPRFHCISLSHFRLDVIKKALKDMTKTYDRDDFNDSWYDGLSLKLQEITEGLPALLVEYMQWIHGNEYVFSNEELESRELFNELAGPYIDRILSLDGLLLTDSDHSDLDSKHQILGQVLLRLSAYRVFSISFLDKVIDKDLKEKMDRMGWTRDDLWQSLLDTSSMDNATPDIWKKIYVAIRRLLFRYNFVRQEYQAAVHQEAGLYYDGFWNEFSGTDKAVVLVERLWHQIEYERLTQVVDADKRLVEFSSSLFEAAITSNHITKWEQSEYLLKRIADDSELINSLQKIDPNIFEKVIQVGQNIKEG